MATVVFFHAHPDDEAIFTGGTMAMLAERQHRVVLVVATAGELGSGRENPTELAARRKSETRASAELLGIHRVEFLDYGDSGMAGDVANLRASSFVNADDSEVARHVSNLLTEENAVALVVYDDQGVYGHPDHIKVHRAGELAAAMAHTPTVYWGTIDGEYLHFVEEHLVDHARDQSVRRSAVGLPTVMITNTVDVRDYVDVKRAAIAAHVSQVQEASAALTMSTADFAAVYGHEWYLRQGALGPIDEL